HDSSTVSTPPSSSAAFPYTTLFRSRGRLDHPAGLRGQAHLVRDHRRDPAGGGQLGGERRGGAGGVVVPGLVEEPAADHVDELGQDRKSTRLNSSHSQISYAVLCLQN